MAHTPSKLGQVVAFSLRHARLTVFVGVIAAVTAGWYATGHFNMTTDTEQLISAKLLWRQNGIAFSKAFPDQGDVTAVVIDGQTPELAERAAQTLADKLAQRKDYVLSVSRPDGGPFWNREGLLLLPLDQVQGTLNQLIAAQPFLGPLAADPSLRGVDQALQTMAMGVQQGSAKAADIDKPVKGLTAAMQSAAAGQPTYFSWQALFSGAGPQSAARKFVLVRPKMDYSALEPGAAASEAIRQTAAAAGLDPAHGVRVRLTGSVPLSDEEFASLADRAEPMLIAMLAAVLVMLWLATRSVLVTGAIMGTTLLGLVITAGLGLLMVGRFNLISVAFIPLFVGLGVDFGIQVAVKYRADTLILPTRDEALIAAGTEVGVPLALAAAAIAVGFFAFMPTTYVGVSELGLIAGAGMVVAFVLAVTVLPALLHLLNPPVDGARAGFERLGKLDAAMHSHRKQILWANGAVALVCLALMPFVRFDSNPLDLKNPKSESMSTLNDLMKDPTQSPETIDILTPSVAAADALSAKLETLPEVNYALTLSTFLPPLSEQQPKLAAIADANTLLDTTINPFGVAPPPSDAELAASLAQTATALRSAAGADRSAAAQDMLTLASALQALATGPAAHRAAADAAVSQPLDVLLGQLRQTLQAQPITLQSLPSDVLHSWVAPDGRSRVEVFPRGGDLNDAQIRKFAKAVSAVAPNASGGPVSIVQAGDTIVSAFQEAGVLSLIAITILLFLVLRRVQDVLYTIAPVIFTGLLTLGATVVLREPINFANIIALPLLFGIGVAFQIYQVMAWRAGKTGFLTSSLARAVLFSGLTTGIAFGALIISSHPGTASMGRLLLISLAFTLATVLFFGPALMGPPPKVKVAEPLA
ncbi:MAG TPA: MMPL family transporter [Caulobacteraceae bacterium]|nr:MMPL family transporter [Caulobacteraceae bacterium]